jgi:hypothetical protein
MGRFYNEWDVFASVAMMGGEWVMREGRMWGGANVGRGDAGTTIKKATQVAFFSTTN